MKSLLIGIALVLFTSGCQRDFSPTEPPAGWETPLPVSLSKAAQATVATANQFSFNLFQETHRQEGAKNVFLSPFSASMALAMAYNGAAGETEKAMATTLGFADLTRDDMNESYELLYNILTKLDARVTLKIANAIWYHHTFEVLTEFIQLNQTYFKAQVSSADFRDPATVDLINDWCRDHTNGHIPKILDVLQPNDVMALLNALYFKGTWTYEFDKTQTRDDLFYQNSGGQVPCKMMTVEGSFHYFQTDEVAAVDLPYGKGLFSMTLLVPAPTLTVDELIAGLTADRWHEWQKKFQLSNGTVQMPRLKLEYEISLNEILSNLGMRVAFNPGQANFSAINKTMPLYISLVKQKTFLQVDEQGTEAAAVTVVTVGYTSVGPSAGFVLRADRPYVMMIRDHATDTILFIGKIMEPNH